MARDSSIRVILRYAVVLGLVCAISALILSGTYDVTRSRIEEGEAQDFYRALAEVLAGDHEFTPIEGLRESWAAAPTQLQRPTSLQMGALAG